MALMPCLKFFASEKSSDAFLRVAQAAYETETASPFV